MSVTDNMVCKGQDPNAKTPAEITFDGSSQLVLSDNKAFGMVCTRQSTKDAAGNDVFDEGIATILTDVPPNGNYTIFMPQDTKLAQNQATSVANDFKTLSDQYKTLIDQVGSLSMQLSKIQNASIDDVIDGTNTPQSGVAGNRNDISGYVSTPNFDQPYVKCPPVPL